MVGFFLFLTIGTCVIIRMWYLLDIKRGLSMRTIGKHFSAKVIGLILVPAVVYMSFFYVHFAVLYRTGPGDDSMSPDFQRMLEGNPMTKQSHSKQ
jgi:dolichyl-phosphate-mannose-protein mannosyltransferase